MEKIIPEIIYLNENEAKFIEDNIENALKIFRKYKKETKTKNGILLEFFVYNEFEEILKHILNILDFKGEKEK
jgi:hypothetical protein